MPFEKGAKSQANIFSSQNMALCFSESLVMNEAYWSVLIGIGAGAFGYWFSTFAVQPILRYRDVRNQILIDFVYFAQVVNADGLNDEMKELYRQRVLANRRSSADLQAAILDLPGWYKLYLAMRGRKPNDAARHLIGFSNTTEYEQSHNLQAVIRRALGLPKED